MINNSLTKYLLYISVSILTLGCGTSNDKNNDNNAEIVVVKTAQDNDSSTPIGTKKMSVVADSLALYADDLTPVQAITVLSTFYRVHLDARANGERRKDIQTMRKFIDVYEIVIGNHRDELRKLMLRAYEADSTLNLPGAIDEFRALLSDYDSAHGQGSEYETVQRRDSVEKPELPKLEAIESIPDDVLGGSSLDFRPAE